MYLPVQTHVVNGTGVIALDRPEALNALDLTMVRAMTAALEAWCDDDGVRSVVVRSTSPKAFCAGGDIRTIREASLRGDHDAVREYFAAEYGLNALIAAYPKPYTALIDGFALGGGLGISVHGTARVVTERAALAMPETAIGFFPDIGASHFLPRLPGSVGWYLGLTGTRISGAAAVGCSLATHYVHAGELPALEEALTGADSDPAAVLDRFAAAAPASELTAHLDTVERCFSAPDLAEVLDRLAAEGGDWAGETLALLRRMSPTSLYVTFELLRRGAGSDLGACLEREFLLACRTARAPDFAEGVRAALVDKDRSPRWSPDPLTAADRAGLLAWFDA
ncbi:enoyl-CoA hydratase/isomerase family protein [Streptomyces sp. H10-C2]|uniref:enoyl-CoA hydratase/isomerase family protein n=1 Tax=unclassified Streptomyces TaxID=2593676 RepID=UPI0024BA8907|nr:MULTISPECIES: enoyl-CoA hydratase/isomerase family protein [unclassified Streptomyces]MDJ0341837.1 enoyl-CoA hydratase/isomerase family protein [Streptomyces sp. PH10-H1]MDJ0370409.1 enoyl-CoA hydratase/isomerase family protein [Streptomyces sp. H10-C2]